MDKLYLELNKLSISKLMELKTQLNLILLNEYNRQQLIEELLKYPVIINNLISNNK
jgi:hypothetical protein